MIRTIGVCDKCIQMQFRPNGVAKARGTKTFNCTNCHEESGTFVDGQGTLCHKCAEKLGKCAMCGQSF